MLKVLCARLSKLAHVAHAALRNRISPIPDRPPLLVDIGARGGLQNKWRLYERIAPLRAVLVEPDSEEAARIRAAHPRHSVLPFALCDTEGTRTLYLTADPGCASLLPPSMRAMKGSQGGRFKPAGTVTLTVTRGDRAFHDAGLPAPDFLKLDTQGTELAILRGFGDLLDTVCAIEVECETVAIYEGQPLLGDVVAFLDSLGFGLVALRPNGLFNEAIWDANAFFARRHGDLSPRGQRLLRTWRTVNRIPTSQEYSIASG